MLERDASAVDILLYAFVVVLALASIFGIYYWLLGLVNCPGDWRGTVALALTTAGGVTRFQKSPS